MLYEDGRRQKHVTKSQHSRKVNKIKKEEQTAADKKKYLALLKQKEKEEENKRFVEAEQKKIRQKQKEAARLEEMESKLLEQLKNTQALENQAFNELEEAMVEAAKNRGPERKRVDESY